MPVTKFIPVTVICTFTRVMVSEANETFRKYNIFTIIFPYLIPTLFAVSEARPSLFIISKKLQRREIYREIRISYGTGRLVFTFLSVLALVFNEAARLAF